MYNYKCDMCGCYLDPGDGKRCDECQAREERRAAKMKSYSEAVRVNEHNQYELILEVG